MIVCNPVYYDPQGISEIPLESPNPVYDNIKNLGPEKAGVFKIVSLMMVMIPVTFTLKFDEKDFSFASCPA